jgi:hypothetical protein
MGLSARTPRRSNENWRCRSADFVDARHKAGHDRGILPHAATASLGSTKSAQNVGRGCLGILQSLFEKPQNLRRQKACIAVGLIDRRIHPKVRRSVNRHGPHKITGLLQCCGKGP